MKTITILIFVVCACAVGSALSFRSNGTVEAEQYTEIDIKDKYCVGDSFKVPTMFVKLGEQNYQMDSVVIFPNGDSYSSDSFVLEEIGNYKLQYTKKVDDRIYKKQCIFSATLNSLGLFNFSNCEVKIGQSDYYNELYGIQVDGGSGTKIEYNRIIDMSKLTKRDLLFEGVVTSNEPSKSDFTELYVSFTDIYDEENQLIVKIKDAQNNSHYLSYIQAKTYGQIYSGLEEGRVNTNPRGGGFIIKHSFGCYYPTEKENAEGTIRLYYDNDESALYAMNRYGIVSQVIDFDNIAHFTKLWKGFTTGEVKMSIYFGGIIGSPRIVIKSINGIEFSSEEYSDNVAPLITLNEPNVLSNAIVGKNYPIFSCDYYDNYAICDTSVKVYERYNVGNKAEVYIKDNAFIPTKAGIYTVEYKAVDFSGNTTIKTVEVNALSECEDISIQIDKGKDTVNAGELFEIKPYNVSGGVGNYTTTIEVKKDNNVIFHCNTPTKTKILESGTYDVEYKCKDYVGNIAFVSYPLDVVFSEKPLFVDKLYMPDAYIVGKKYQLPNYNAYEVKDGQSVALTPTITASIDGQAVSIDENRYFIPNTDNENSEIEVTYSFITSKGQTDRITKKIPLIKAINNNKYNLEKFFKVDGINVSALSREIRFETTELYSKLDYIDSVQAINFVIKMGVSAFNADYFDITLKDKLNYDISFKVRVFKNGNVSINDGEIKELKDFTLNDFSFTFSNKKCILYDTKLNTVDSITKCLNGDDFKGFTSDEVFLSIEVYNSVTPTVFSIVQINNQIYSKIERDNIAPQIFIDDRVGGSYNVGDVVTIYAPKYFDVLSSIKIATVSVKEKSTNNFIVDKNGNTLKNVDINGNYSFELNAIGSYMVDYLVVDENDREVPLQKTLYVFDNVKPTIEIKGKFNDKAKVGENITLPEIRINDNGQTQPLMIICVIEPNGCKEILQDRRFTPKQKGIYTIIYFVMDENNRTSYYEKTIMVD